MLRRLSTQLFEAATRSASSTSTSTTARLISTRAKAPTFGPVTTVKGYTPRDLIGLLLKDFSLSTSNPQPRAFTNSVFQASSWELFEALCGMEKKASTAYTYGGDPDGIGGFVLDAKKVSQMETQKPYILAGLAMRYPRIFRFAQERHDIRERSLVAMHQACRNYYGEAFNLDLDSLDDCIKGRISWCKSRDYPERENNVGGNQALISAIEADLGKDAIVIEPFSAAERKKILAFFGKNPDLLSVSNVSTIYQRVSEAALASKASVRNTK